MLFVKVPVILSLILTALSPTWCSPIYETNGQRMARGLPPSPPKFGRDLPGNIQNSESTPVSTAKRPSASPTPSVYYEGRIQARNEDGAALGFVRNPNSSKLTIGGLNFLGSDQELHVNFTVPSSGNSPFDILATKPLFPAPFYVGASGTTSVNSIGGDSHNTVSLTNVQRTPPHSVPVASAFDNPPSTFVESAIWSIDPHTKELKAQYVNPDGSKPTTIIGYNKHGNKLFFTGNITLFGASQAIKLYLIPA